MRKHIYIYIYIYMYVYILHISIHTNNYQAHEAAGVGLWNNMLQSVGKSLIIIANVQEYSN